jgi:uncharacterized protein (DUF362 family)
VTFTSFSLDTFFSPCLTTAIFLKTETRKFMIAWFEAPKVAIQHVLGEYSNLAPFNPEVAYPEYPFKTICTSCVNPAYEGVRETLRLLGMDQTHYSQGNWNPLGELIQPGNHILIKPNLIRESHGRRPAEWEQVITHGSVIRAVLDYVFIALQGNGRVVIADGPQTDSDFELICQRIGLLDMVAFYKGFGLDVTLLDLRRDRWFQKGNVIYKRIPLPGDPAGYTTVELGEASEFSNYALNGHFYGADYDMAETASYHTGGRHAYVMCRSAMDADVVINLPKMKTHKKTGVTLSLKNMVGINGYRNCLPHHTIGTPDEYGDEFPVAGLSHKIQSRGIVGFKKALIAMDGKGGGWARWIKRVGRSIFGDTENVIRSGNWYGNDTAWRMVLDLNKALFYFDGDGKPRRKPLRYLTIIDGILAGQGNGPINPDAIAAGIIVGGFNPLAVDTVAATVMGFAYHKLPVLEQGWQISRYPLAAFGTEAVNCISNNPDWNSSFEMLEHAPHLAFRPHFGWKGAIERTTNGFPIKSI